MFNFRVNRIGRAKNLMIVRTRRNRDAHRGNTVLPGARTIIKGSKKVLIDRTGDMIMQAGEGLGLLFHPAEPTGTVIPTPSIFTLGPNPFLGGGALPGLGIDVDATKKVQQPDQSARQVGQRK